MNEEMRAALEAQSRACAHFGSAFSAGLLERIAGAAGTTPALDRLFQPWKDQQSGELLAAAVPLRLLGALHDLALSGGAPALSAAYPGGDSDGDAAAAWTATQAALSREATRLADFMAHEPQTNEVRRSAALLGGFLSVAAETGRSLRIFELGASAGLNLAFDAFSYRLGDVGRWGDRNAQLRLETDWRGPPPRLDAPLQVATRAGCDRRPTALADKAACRRLRAYIWPDQPERLAAFDAALGVAAAKAIAVEQADAAEFVAARVAPKSGAATVVYHSIVWQYLAAPVREALSSAIHGAGESARADAPLAWLRLEPAPGAPLSIELRLTTWPGGAERLLARAHPHGAWVEWLAGG